MDLKIYVNNLSDYLNKEITSDFLVTQKELREGTRDYYIRLRLADSTGSVVGNVWNNAHRIAQLFDEGDVIRIKAVVINYKSQIQLTVNKVRKLEEDQYDISDFIETTSKDINKLSDRLFGFIDSIKNEYLKKLLLSIFDDKEFYKKFSTSPAAKTWHHNYVGGLLEHTVSVATICDFVSKMYQVDRDLLVAGALVHDIGKVQEYHIKTAIDFTDVGRLIGHLSLGDELVCNKAKEINNFPPELLMKLRHLILSHHGEYEKASVRLPQTLEAVVLHFADNIDAQTIGVQQLINSGKSTDAQWSEYDKLNNRYYFIK